MRTLCVGLIGDYDETVIAHQAIPLALQLAAEANALSVRFDWLPTDQIKEFEVIGEDSTGANTHSKGNGRSYISVSDLANFAALWCVPASPYRSMDGALFAIRYAREHNIPFLGTCGGFQHAVIEYARNVLGWRNADHAEISPNSERAVIAPLTCSLVEKSETLSLLPNTKLARAYGKLQIHEGYHCSYGINPAFRSALTRGSLREAAEDAGGELRAVELDGHPFFVATLFQPERAALRGEVPPIVAALLQAAKMRQ